MHRSTSILALAALSVTLASCYGPEEEPRPFSRGARSLDNPPRYGDSRYGENRYMDPGTQGRRDGPIGDPSVPGGIETPGATPSGVGGPIDPGLSAVPPGSSSTTTTTTTVVPPPGVTGGPAVSPPVTPPPAPGDVPYAKSVPGKPGYVYNPHDGKILDVTGMRPGTKVKDPATGAMFRVP